MDLIVADLLWDINFILNRSLSSSIQRYLTLEFKECFENIKCAQCIE